MNYNILYKMDAFDDKTIIVTFEKPVSTNTIKLDTGNLFN
jgi:ABC-type transport system substrate-binding protein